MACSTIGPHPFDSLPCRGVVELVYGALVDLIRDSPHQFSTIIAAKASPQSALGSLPESGRFHESQTVRRIAPDNQTDLMGQCGLSSPFHPKWRAECVPLVPLTKNRCPHSPHELKCTKEPMFEQKVLNRSLDPRPMKVHQVEFSQECE